MHVDQRVIRLEAQPDPGLRPPPSGACVMPLTRQLDQRYLPIWNTSVLRHEWRQQHWREQQLAAERGVLTAKQVSEERRRLLIRSLAGPLSRQLVADEVQQPIALIRKQAKEWGLWVRATENEMGLNPFQQLMFQLFARCGEGKAPLWFDFDEELEADTAAQLEIDRIRARSSKAPAVPEQIGIWKVLSEPFLAVDRRDGLSWWVECLCTAPGCRYNTSRWRPIDALKNSRAKQCPQHNHPPGATLSRLEGVGDAFTAMRRRHVPALFSGLAETRHPDMAQGVLADYRALLNDPPSLREPQVQAHEPPKLRNPSLYFPPAPALTGADEFGGETWF